MYRDTSSVDCAPRELTHACSRSDTCSLMAFVCIKVNVMVYIYSPCYRTGEIVFGR